MSTDLTARVEARIAELEEELSVWRAALDRMDSGEAAVAVEKPKTSRKAKSEKTTPVEAKRNGRAHGGERKQQIIELLAQDMAVMDIARELGTHPNYVRAVKKNYEAENTPSGRRIARAK